MPSGSRQPLSQPAVFGMFVCALAFACVCLHSAPTFAQQVNLDYYKSAGMIDLRDVERFHVGPAMDELRVRRYEAAIAHIEFVLRHFPNHPQALMLMIEVCAQWKSPRCDPTEPFENAIAVNPNVAATYTLQGIYLYRIQRLPAAAASFEKALTLDPDSVNAHYNLGLVYVETRQFELANVHAQRAYQLGASVPGLRDRLIRAGQWKPTDAPVPDAATSIGPGSKASTTSR